MLVTMSKTIYDKSPFKWVDKKKQLFLKYPEKIFVEKFAELLKKSKLNVWLKKKII